MQYKGLITYISDLELVGENKLQKKTIVLEEISDKKWKGGLAIDFLKDKVSMLDIYKVGDEVVVDINTKCTYSEKSKRYYNNINGWKIDYLGEKKSNVEDDKGFDDSLPF